MQHVLVLLLFASASACHTNTPFENLAAQTAPALRELRAPTAMMLSLDSADAEVAAKICVQAEPALRVLADVSHPYQEKADNSNVALAFYPRMMLSERIRKCARSGDGTLEDAARCGEMCLETWPYMVEDLEILRAAASREGTVIISLLPTWGF